MTRPNCEQIILVTGATDGIGKGTARELVRFGARLLLPNLRRAAPARAVNVASAGQAPLGFDDPMLERGYDGFSRLEG